MPSSGMYHRGRRRALGSMIAQSFGSSVREVPMHQTASGLDDDAPAERTAPPVPPLALELLSWRAGDSAALERIVRRFSSPLWHIARSYNLDAATAEDAVQATWLAFVRHSHTVRQPEALAGWLATTVRREAIRLSRSRTSPARDGDEERPEKADPTQPTPEEAAIASLESRVLWSHVARLSERCRRMLRVVAFAQDPDYASMSHELGMAVGSIGPTRRRCLDKLRVSLAADPGWIDR